MRAGFIGLGHIGRGMAHGLLAAGFPTTVYDVMPEGPAELAAVGARSASSPAEVAQASDAIGICVRTDDEVLDVIAGDQGLLAGASPGLLIAIHSTVRPSTIKEAARLAAEKGARVVDAPVSRGAPNADGRSIVYMLAGAEADIADARELVKGSAKDIIVAGPLGAAMALKICNNLVTYLEFLAAAEADRLARLTGLAPELLLQVMTANGNATPSMQALISGRLSLPGPPPPEMVKTFEGISAVAEKDLDCALEVGRELGVDLPGATLARQAIRHVYLNGFQD